jgi:hypothetical protein
MIFNKTYILFIFLIVSCSKDKTDPPLPCPEEPSFFLTIKPIFDNNCIQCHNNNYAEDNVILEDYNSIVGNINSSLTRIKNGTMPYDENYVSAISSSLIDPIEDSIIQKIECWVENGMKNN